MLNCCLDLETVKKTGITLPDFRCLAHCQGLSVNLRYADESSSLTDFREAVQRACVDADAVEDITNNNNDDDDNDDDNDSRAEQNPMEVLVVSYSRKILGQTGSGHFSPIGAYDSDSDSVLILDTARFKYGAHWVQLPMIYDAMKPIDPDTGKSRGFALLSFAPPKALATSATGTSTALATGEGTAEQSEPVLQPISMLFRSKMSQQAARLKYKEFLENGGDDSNNSKININNRNWDAIMAYWTKGGVGDPCVWEIIEPLKFRFENECEEIAVTKLRKLALELVAVVDQDREAPCCDAKIDRQADCVSEREALFIVYLASLEVEERQEFVRTTPSTAEDLTKEQLLVEAELIASAIEISDELTFPMSSGSGSSSTSSNSN